MDMFWKSKVMDSMEARYDLFEEAVVRYIGSSVYLHNDLIP